MKQLAKFMVSIVGLVFFLTSISLAEQKWVPILMEEFTIIVPDGNISTTTNNLVVPTFTSNSQGKLVIQCETDIVYYIMAYDCLRSDTNPYAKTSVGTVVVDDKQHVGEVFYEKGHVIRTGGPVTITGEVFSGGQILYTWPDWIQTCP
ncbi:hypothetical protein C9926_01865 [Sulfurovum lithotrophicum]|nr:hypothetical protein C9926_01865 [Sulfurovum lithotrophicum]